MANPLILVWSTGCPIVAITLAFLVMSSGDKKMIRVMMNPFVYLGFVVAWPLFVAGMLVEIAFMYLHFWRDARKARKAVPNVA